MEDVKAQKKGLRQLALELRKNSNKKAHDLAAQLNLLSVLNSLKIRGFSGYIPIGSEIDPVPVMVKQSKKLEISVPVVDSPDAPLKFSKWIPGCEMLSGPYNVQIPRRLVWVVPDLLIVPLLLFDPRGARLGYGGGFYDRTIQQLRSRENLIAIGLAYSSQQVDSVPVEDTDQYLDGVVTEKEIFWFNRGF